MRSLLNLPSPQVNSIKYCIYFLFAIIISSATWWGCKKDVESNFIEGQQTFSLNISSAKSMFLQEYQINNELQLRDGSENETISQGINPNWDLAIEYFDQNKNQYVVEVPLINDYTAIRTLLDDTTKIFNQIEDTKLSKKSTKLIFIQSTDGKTIIGLFHLNGSQKFNQTSNILNSTYQNIQLDFEGLCYFTDFRDSILQSYFVTNNNFCPQVEQNDTVGLNLIEQRGALYCIRTYTIVPCPCEGHTSNDDKCSCSRKCKVLEHMICFLVGGGSSGTSRGPGIFSGFNTGGGSTYGSGSLGSISNTTAMKIPLNQIRSELFQYLAKNNIDEDLMSLILPYVNKDCINTNSTNAIKRDLCYEKAVDQYYTSIINRSVNSSGLLDNPCAISVYNTLAQNSIFNLFMKPFRQAILTNASIKFEISDDLPSSVFGRTLDFSNYQLIKLNREAFGRISPTLAADVILHEVMHAFLNVWYKNRNSGTVPGIWQLFLHLFYDNSANADHQVMADTYRNYLINGIREFDLLRNPPIIRTNQYYSDLTWFGIRSDAGQIYDNLSQSEKDRIQNLINIENFAGGCN